MSPAQSESTKPMVVLVEEVGSDTLWVSGMMIGRLDVGRVGWREGRQ